MSDRVALSFSSFSLRTWLLLALAGVVTLFGLFLILAEEVVLDGRNGLDHAVTLDVHGWVTPQRTELMRFVTTLGSTWCVLVIYAVIVIWLLWQRRFRTVIALVSIFMLAELLNYGLKLAFARPRPSIVPHIDKAGGYSFPSGHMMGATMAWGVLAMLLMERLDGRARFVPPVVAALIIVSVGFSRVYLGVHYLTDVLAGGLVAGACLILARAALCLLDRPTR